MACVALSCGDKARDGFLPFEVYGRVVWRPPLFGSAAEFYIYHDGQPVTDAQITVGLDTIPLVNAASGYYSKALTIAIGDTLDYSVESPIWSSQGTVVIPDTTEILCPVQNDTLRSGIDFTARWRNVFMASGYFVFIDDQDGLSAEVMESRFDTSAVLPGIEIINGGNKYFWVEVLGGDVLRRTAPDGRILPSGVVGAAGNYREVYISLLG